MSCSAATKTYADFQRMSRSHSNSAVPTGSASSSNRRSHHANAPLRRRLPYTSVCRAVEVLIMINKHYAVLAPVILSSGTPCYTPSGWVPMAYIDDPAISVMTYFKELVPITNEPNFRIEAALRKIKVAGVRRCSYRMSRAISSALLWPLTYWGTCR